VEVGRCPIQQPADPVIVKIIEPPSDVEGLADVLLGALGLTGIFVLAAVLLALLMAGVLFWFRFKWGDPYPAASSQRPGEDTHSGHITR
jgi:hypothetical protein